MSSPSTRLSIILYLEGEKIWLIMTFLGSSNWMHILKASLFD